MVLRLKALYYLPTYWGLGLRDTTKVCEKNIFPFIRPFSFPVGKHFAAEKHDSHFCDHLVAASKEITENKHQNEETRSVEIVDRYFIDVIYWMC